MFLSLFQFNTPVLERASSDAVWHSAIGGLEVRVDLGRQGLASLELPGWGQGFQLYVTRVPGRSIVLFERFEMRKNESEVRRHEYFGNILLIKSSNFFLTERVPTEEKRGISK